MILSFQTPAQCDLLIDNLNHLSEVDFFKLNQAAQSKGYELIRSEN